MPDDDVLRRIADLELKVGYLVQLVENLYQQPGIGQPLNGQQPSNGQPPVGGPEVDPEFRNALEAGSLIAAIKRYRELTGVGLKEAKDAVEAMAGRR